MLTKNDLTLLSKKGITITQVEKQLSFFKAGMKPVLLDRPAIPDDGIEVFTEGGVLMYAGIFDKNSANFSKVKFVPASGAASRMFKDLFTALEDFKSNTFGEMKVVDENELLSSFFNNLVQYPFYNDLDEIALRTGEGIQKLIREENYSRVLNLLLTEIGLNYGAKPKGVLKFHAYEGYELTPVEEHVAETAQYNINKDGSLKLHFTVSPEHQELFKKITDALKVVYKKKNIQLQIEYSIQEPATDTIAVDLANEPFRESDENIHFRPGGHGALLLNLAKLEEDIIFIGNIDNVCPDKEKPSRVLYKKFLGGYLLEKVSIIRQLLNNLEKGLNSSVRKDILLFVENNISVELADKLAGFSEEEFSAESFQILNRPVRVCGMVKNTGEPGGGPFWVKGKDGRISKQVIESSQIDLNDDGQKEIFHSSTHFNPVDIVCCIKDYKGNLFDLPSFRDDDMAFIAKKSAGGRELKALELPGLWNGSMAGWISFFNEVPLETFSPVKTVFDLIRPEHQT